MTFETLKDLHLWKIEVLLHSGEKYEGVITSHTFRNKSQTIVKEISLLGEKELARIRCEEIKEVRKLESLK